jgi:hypothetical protein
MPTMRWVAHVPDLKGGRRSLANAKWAWEANQLRKHPGRWAILATAKSALAAGQQANAVRKGIYQAFRPSGEFEATNRGNLVYARYVGNTSEKSEN